MMHIEKVFEELERQDEVNRLNDEILKTTVKLFEDLAKTTEEYLNKKHTTKVNQKISVTMKNDNYDKMIDEYLQDYILSLNSESNDKKYEFSISLSDSSIEQINILSAGNNYKCLMGIKELLTNPKIIYINNGKKYDDLDALISSL